MITLRSIVNGACTAGIAGACVWTFWIWAGPLIKDGLLLGALVVALIINCIWHVAK